MFLVNCVILLIYLMLAIISRKHFSKYKDKQVKGGFVAVVFCQWGKRYTGLSTNTYLWTESKTGLEKSRLFQRKRCKIWRKSM